VIEIRDSLFEQQSKHLQWTSDNHGEGGGGGRELADEEYLQQPMSFAGAATPPNVAKIITHTSHAQTSSQHLAWIPLDSSCMRTFAKHPPPIVRRSKLAKTDLRKMMKAHENALEHQKKDI